jgi:spermidine/putrescine-binding protein
MTGLSTISLLSLRLLARLDPEMIPNMKEIHPRFIAKGYWGAGLRKFQDKIVYSTDAPEFKETIPDTHQLLSDPRFKNRVMVSPWSWGDGVGLIALVARLLGKDEHSVDDKVFNKIKGLKPQMLTFGENFAETVEVFKSGGIALGYYSPQAFAYDILVAKKPYPIGIGRPREGVVGICGCVQKSRMAQHRSGMTKQW